MDDERTAAEVELLAWIGRENIRAYSGKFYQTEMYGMAHNVREYSAAELLKKYHNEQTKGKGNK